MAPRHRWAVPNHTSPIARTTGHTISRRSVGAPQRGAMYTDQLQVLAATACSSHTRRGRSWSAGSLRHQASDSRYVVIADIWPAQGSAPDDSMRAWIEDRNAMVWRPV